MTEGVDYSSTANADWAGLARSLKASGKSFVGRYAVNDKSPSGRGIGAAEYAAMRDAGIGVFLYWESSEGWMTNGWSAGVQAAENAQWNIDSAGMPEDVPVYFACDFDAEPSDQDAINSCLAGAASVLGFERVGLYAGYHVLARAKMDGACRWFCQTLAWSGGMLMDGVHLYQYSTNGNYIYGTDVDLVRAYADNYGQVSPPVAPEPIPDPVPEPPKFAKPGWTPVRDGKDHKDARGTLWRAVDRVVRVKGGTQFYAQASLASRATRDPAPDEGLDVRVAWTFNSWYVTPYGSRFKISQSDIKTSFKDLEV